MVQSPGPSGPASPAASTAAVAVQGLGFRYPGSTQGVDDIDLTINPGEMLVCVGPSGCGKTTLLRLIAGFLQPDRGRIVLGGMDQAGRPPRERDCGIVFQSYALFPTMRVWENVAYPLRVRGVDRESRRRRALDMLALAGLADHAERMPTALSGGQQQRVALARALVFEPKALLLDEPLSALDATTRHAMREEILRIQRARGIATLMITHDQDEALSMGDRVAVLNGGRLMQCDTPQRLYDAPANAFVAGFVGRANLIEGTIRPGGGVQTAYGTFALSTEGLSPGSPVTLLIRPERIEAVTAHGADSHAGVARAVRILRDDFHGVLRRVTVQVADVDRPLTLETMLRTPFNRIRIPTDAVRLLPESLPAKPPTPGA